MKGTTGKKGFSDAYTISHPPVLQMLLTKKYELSSFLLTHFFPGCLMYVIYCQGRKEFLLRFIETRNNKVHYTKR